MLQSQKQTGEMLYAIEKQNGECVITGFIEREAAHRLGTHHLSVIIVPFVVPLGAGGEHGAQPIKWLVHNRAAKQWGKGRQGGPNPSFNLFGGHCAADAAEDGLGVVPFSVFDATAEEERLQELLWRGGPAPTKQLEVWENGVKTNRTVSASPYSANGFIKIGFTSHESKNNVETSFVYALPVPENDVENLVAADNYMRDGKEHDVYLPLAAMEEAELQKLAQNPTAEICDAITRLWLADNAAALETLHSKISEYLKQSKPLT